VSDEPAEAAPVRVRKYEAPDSMRKEIERFLRARNATVLMRRYGDDDAPVPAVMPVQAIRSVSPVREINRTIR
jgi:hypothetical protein